MKFDPGKTSPGMTLFTRPVLRQTKEALHHRHPRHARGSSKRREGLTGKRFWYSPSGATTIHYGHGIQCFYTLSERVPEDRLLALAQPPV